MNSSFVESYPIPSVLCSIELIGDDYALEFLLLLVVLGPVLGLKVMKVYLFFDAY